MTTPYMTGTVSVTAGSAVVTGAGTAWQTALVAGGLFGLDSSNGNPVPILSVDSNTQLTLAKPWRGTTASGQAYWIIRDTAYLQQLVTNAQALTTYIQRLDNAALAALAGLTPAADRMAYFTGSGSAALGVLTGAARALLNLSGSAANGKIPVLTGSGAAAIRDIVGSVGQSGGVPTGALIERGSNANGEYVRFADGTQICWGDVVVSFATTSALVATWTYPIGFTVTFPRAISVTADWSVTTGALGTGGYWTYGGGALGGVGTATANIRLGKVAGANFASGDSVMTRCIATGRWF